MQLILINGRFCIIDVQMGGNGMETLFFQGGSGTLTDSTQEGNFWGEARVETFAAASTKKAGSSALNETHIPEFDKQLIYI